MMGIALLVIGFILGYSAVTTYHNRYGSFIGNSYDAQIFWNEAQSYVIGAVLSLVVGGVLATVPDRQKTTEETSLSTPLIQGASTPAPKTGTCPSCGHTAVYVTEYQRWYCPEEKKYI